MFKAKVRKVGTSLGVLIPKDFAQKEKIKEGEEIEVGVLKKRNIEDVLRLVGAIKGSRPFVRDRTDRVDRY
ncbi:MAG: AbrB/MazE/SpoVT family DNA-binding domain-containing protein [Candidatus Aenigmarchaeota archaeon]|nr:AbrB/MazE/SpoVT family DNA-binding domain-containing protein [Candidatus Aenigmarchaeota archaeon]